MYIFGWQQMSTKVLFHDKNMFENIVALLTYGTWVAFLKDHYITIFKISASSVVRFLLIRACGTASIFRRMNVFPAERTNHRFGLMVSAAWAASVITAWLKILVARYASSHTVRL